MSEPIKIIEDILKSAYSTEGFVAFVKEIFDSIKIIAPDKKNKEYHAQFAKSGAIVGLGITFFFLLLGLLLCLSQLLGM